MRVSNLHVFVAGCGLLFGGCSQTRTAHDVLRDYASAVERGNAQAARALVSAEYLEETGEERFAAGFERRVAAGEAFTDRLRKAADGEANVTATWEFGVLEKFEMEFDGEQWRVVRGGGVFGGPQTARDAILAFVRAVESHDPVALFTIMPSEYREQITVGEIEDWLVSESENLDAIVALIRATSAEPLVVYGDSALLQYGSRQMHLKREEDTGIWVIADFD